MNFVRFVKAAGVAGITSAGLGLVLFAIAIIEHINDKNVPVYWLLGVGVLSLLVSSYRAWATEHEAYLNEVAKSSKPSLKIEMPGSFYDISRIPNTNKIQLHVCAYLKVTNLTAPETLIKDGYLVMTVGGIQYKGLGDDKGVKGNSLEHITDFKIGGETTNQDVFGKNTLSPFKRLPALNADSPLKRGITQEGFFVFTFTDQSINWNHEDTYYLPVSDFALTLRDSFDGIHTLDVMILKIPQAQVQATNAQFEAWKGAIGGKQS
jgi:hypothetical protein